MRMNNKWYKLPQLWVLVAIITIIAAFIVNNNITTMNQKQHQEVASETSTSSEDSSVDSSTAESLKSSSEAESVSIASSEAKEASETASSMAAEKDPDSYNTGITYDQIARTPDQFKKQKMSFTGRVIQVTEDGDAELRIAVDGNYDNVIYVFVDKKLINKSRILEDDLVTVSGKSKGTISYESTGNGKITVPAMDAKIINDQGKASDDYGE